MQIQGPPSTWSSLFLVLEVQGHSCWLRMLSMHVNACQCMSMHVNACQCMDAHQSDVFWACERWYPDGVPLMFFSVHNTKRFDRTDKPGPQAMFPGEKWAVAGLILPSFIGQSNLYMLIHVLHTVTCRIIRDCTLVLDVWGMDRFNVPGSLSLTGITLFRDQMFQVSVFSQLDLKISAQASDHLCTVHRSKLCESKQLLHAWVLRTLGVDFPGCTVCDGVWRLCRYMSVMFNVVC